MKIDRIVLAWDGNPRYDGFYEMHRALWGKQGIKTGLAFVSDGKNSSAIPTTGDVVVVEDRSTVPYTPLPGRNWKATMALIHGPRLFPGEVTMVLNMDLFLASRRLLDAIAGVPDDEMALSYCVLPHICTNEIIAHHDLWSRIMAPAPMDFTELLEWTWEQKFDLSGYAEIAVGWGNDEVLFSHLVMNCDGVRVNTMFSVDEWLNRILGITQTVPDPEKLKAGFYSSLHVRNPLSKQDRWTFNTLLEMEALP